MKNNIFLLLTMILLISLNSCNDDDNKDEKFDLDVNFKIEYGGEPLVMFEEFEYPSGEKLKFSRYSFYLSNLALNYQDGQKQMMDVQYLNFTNQNVDLVGAEEGLTLSFSDVKSSDLEQLFFMIGVDETNNALTPADFPSSNDLSKSSEYWGGWESYVFTKTEGQINVDGEIKGFSLHTGSDEARVDFLLNAEELGQNDKNRVEIIIDLKDYFGGTENTYDIIANPQLHSLDQKPQVLELTNNLSTSLKYRIIKG